MDDSPKEISLEETRDMDAYACLETRSGALRRRALKQGSRAAADGTIAASSGGAKCETDTELTRP